MAVLQTLRNVAIIAVLALGVTVLPGGGAGAETILNALVMGFLAAIAWAAYSFYRQQEMTMMTLTDGRRAILFGSVGLIALLVAGLDQFLEWGGGAFVGWIALMALAVGGIVAVWRDATRFT